MAVHRRKSSTLKTIVAYPGNMSHAQQIARAMLEIEALKAFVTTYSYRANDVSGSLLRFLPSKVSRRIARQLKRRAITEIPAKLCALLSDLGNLRSMAQKGGASPVVVDMVFDQSAHSFDAMVARRYVPEAMRSMASSTCRSRRSGGRRKRELARSFTFQLWTLHKYERSSGANEVDGRS